jgi:hypothetical protein
MASTSADRSSDRCPDNRSESKVFASFKSSVSKPSVNYQYSLLVDGGGLASYGADARDCA